jgi:hypothetical protein
MSNSAVDWQSFLDSYGYYAVSFTLAGTEGPSLKQLADWMRGDRPQYTGWPPFWWPTRSEIAPRVIDQDTYECLHDGTGFSGAVERWRASTTGLFTIVRAYDSDRETEPGKYLELAMPAWRISELLLYAGRMAVRFGAKEVDLTVRFEGLAGRTLRASWAPPRLLMGQYTTDAQRYERRVLLATEDIETGVIEMTDNLVRGLFELFQFVLPGTLCEAEITRMRSNRY